MRIKDVKKNVERILESWPETRSSDGLLYYAYGLNVLGSDMTTLRAADMLINRKQYNLPTLEAVRRARQKVQAERHDLAGDSQVEGYRRLNEEEYEEFARSI